MTEHEEYLPSFEAAEQHREKKEIKKPHVRFCWGCGRKLWGNYHRVITLEDGTERIVHKSYPTCQKGRDEVGEAVVKVLILVGWTFLVTGILLGIVSLLFGCSYKSTPSDATTYRHYDSKQRYQGRTICYGDRCRSYDKKGKFQTNTIKE